MELDSSIANTLPKASVTKITNTFNNLPSKILKVHGDRYDYSKVVFRSTTDKVTIVCKVHGDFQQSMHSHVGAKKAGCRKCAIEDRAKARKGLSAETFIAKCTAVHGGKYDYTETEYTSSTGSIKVVCKEHGAFYIIAGYHKEGGGCKECGTLRRHTVESFKLKAKRVHNGKYSYENVTSYTNNNDTLVITCPAHGDFTQRASMHMAGKGCTECNGGVAINQDTFIARATAVHNGVYTYAKCVYTKASDKVTVTCHEHGDFTQNANSHMSGRGCPSCRSHSDNNALYLWEAVGLKHNGVQVYKIGVTSTRLGDKRIREVARKASLEFKIIKLIEVDNAQLLEKQALNCGTCIDMGHIDGRTEFRALTDEQLALIIKSHFETKVGE